MEFNCEICNFFIKPKSKYKHFKSNIQKELDKWKLMKLNIENPDINNIERAFYEYIFQHKKLDVYLIISQFNRSFNERQSCPYVT